MWPIWLRAVNSMQSAEFQKILSHPGIMFCDPAMVMARLQLGRAWGIAGEQSKARAAYHGLFRLWKDADRDVPTLKDAKGEYAKL